MNNEVRKQTLGIVGMSFHGDYSASETYKRGYVVVYEGSSYVAIKTTRGNLPTNTNYFQLVARKPIKGIDYFTEQDKQEIVDEVTEDAESEFNQNVVAKTNEFNQNATNKTSEFDTNASSKTTAFNTNASNKIDDFNTNATSKTNDFNSNASAKVGEYNDNASDKIDEFDTHVDEKTDEFDEHVESYSEELERAEMVYNALPKVSDEDTEFSLDGTAECPVYEVGLRPSELEQETTSISEGDEYDSPSPDYPQDIHVVSGDNSVVISNKNINSSELESGSLQNGENYPNYIPLRTKDYISIKANTDYAFSINSSLCEVVISMYDNNKTFISTWGSEGYISSNGLFTTPNNAHYIRYRCFNNDRTLFETGNIQLEEGTTATAYEEHKEQNLPISLGDLEYCKIGDYEDLFFKNVVGSEYYDSTLVEDKWYLKKNVEKRVFDGTENWAMWNIVNVNTQRFYLDLPNNGVSTATAKSDKFYYLDSNNDVEHYRISQSLNMFFNEIVIFVNRLRLSEVTTTAFKRWMSDNNIIFYRVVATPTYTLLNNTLQTQLDNIQKAISYQEQTNVSQVNDDLPFIIKLSAIRDLSGIFDLISQSEEI